MNNGYIRLEIDCVTGEKLIFLKSDAPGALVQVTLNGETVQVRPPALLMAIKLFGED